MVVSKEGKRRRKVTAIAQAGGPNPTGTGTTTTNATAERDLSPPDIPKRPKVHAQRKFAQGQGAPSSSYLNYSSAPPTPAKDAQNIRNSTGTGNNNGSATTVAAGGPGSESTPQVTELLPNMRPNTEDFLTFLCFRGTPVLPPALDYFNKSATTTTTGTNSSNHAGASTSGGPTVGRQSKQNETTVQSSAPAAASSSSKTSNSQKQQATTPEKKQPVAELKSAVEEKPKPAATVAAAATAPAGSYMPFAVRKRAEQHPVEARPDRKRTQDKMQALRKKYHDQRVAKLRATNNGKQLARVAAAANTRSSKLVPKEPSDSSENEEEDAEEEKPKQVTKQEPEEEDDDDDNDDDDNMEEAKEVRKGKGKQLEKESPPGGKRKSGLRSGSLVPQSSSPVPESGKGVAARNARRKRDSAKGNVKEEQSPSVVKAADGKTPSKSKKSPTPEQVAEEAPKEASQGRATTGGKRATKVPSPTRTAKNSPPPARSESEGREKRTTRLSALRSPPTQATGKLEEKSAASTSAKEKESTRHASGKEEKVEYSSEDDEPLSRSTRTEKRSGAKEVVVGKITRSGRSRKSEPSATADKEPDETPDKKSRRAVSVLSRFSEDEGSTGKKTPQNQPKRGKKRKDTGTQDGGSIDDKEQLSESAEPAPAAGGGRRQAAANASKKKKETTTAESVEDTMESTDAEEKKPKTASSTPVESLGGTGRPSRKTKEAATLYMELIGRRLNHDDKSDDDASSLDSLELPNVRKLEQMENELKANAGKKDGRQQPQQATMTTTAAAAAAGGGKSVPAKSKAAKAAANAKLIETKKKKLNADETTSQVDEESNNKTLERSFSDSDEEPLASKFQRKKQQLRQQTAAAAAGSKGRQPGGKLPAKASPGRQRANNNTTAAGKGKSEDDEGRSSEPEQSPDPDGIKPSGEETAKQQGSPTVPAMTSTPKGTPKRAAAPPNGKQNGKTAATGAATTSFIGGAAAASLKTPTKMGSKTTPLSSPQESPAVANMRESDGNLSSSRMNKSLDNTLPSTTVEASESPIKIPQVLNIPTFIGLPGVATSPTTSQQSPFTRTAKPVVATNSTTELDNSAVAAAQLEKSPPGGTAGNGPTTAAPTVDNVPFNRPAPLPVHKVEFIPKEEPDFLKSFEPTDPSVPIKSSGGNSLLGNLLPSKEESEKIFGIASVSLAQSSGPLDTKCTLGKCGSVHKPPLGPPVLTESMLGGSLSPRDRRKAKVNMTHEQIQKWIDESSWSPIEDDLKDEDLEIEPTSGGGAGRGGGRGGTASASVPKTPPPPTGSSGQAATVAAQSAAISWERLNVTESGGLVTSDPSMAITVPVPATTATPLLLQTPLVGRTTKDDNGRSALPTTTVGQTIDGTASKLASPLKDPPSQDISPTGTMELGGNGKTAPVEQKRTSTTPTGRQTRKEAAPSTPTTGGGKREVKETRKSKVETSGGSSSMTTNAPATRSPATTPTTADRKPIYRTTTGRTPVYKQDLPPAANAPASKVALGSNPTQTTPTAPRSAPAAAAAATAVATQLQASSSSQANSNKFGAFSPVNEPSVYSFDKEEDFMPVATPFRRQHTGTTGRRESCNSSARDEPPSGSGGVGTKRAMTPLVADEKVQKGTGSVASGKGTGNVTGTGVNPNDTAKSAGTGARGRAADVEKKIRTAPLEEETAKAPPGVAIKPEAASTSDTEADAGGQTFYIPLQGPSAAAAGSSGSGGGKAADQLIQGVAVKLGTEGPDGPNQRVIMHAKLVTKAEMGSNPTTLPESMNVQELVKSLTQAQAAGGSGVSTSAASALTKEGLSKLVPVGTVQPRFKSTTDGASSGTPPAPAEDRNSAEPPMSRGGLSRINSNSSLSSQRSKPTKQTSGGGGTGPGSTAGITVKGGGGGGKGDSVLAPQPDNNTVFPRRDDPAQMVEAPVFKPTEKEFLDPMEYIERIAPVASRFGICRIIPPASFKPECRIADDMRFMAYNQYVHKMLHRWGPSAKEYAAIKKYLATQSINLQSPPVIGGMEVDLPRLYHTVQELGGLKEVIEKKRWARVSEDMCIPKAAHDRVSKLDDIYCKYLLPYDTLSPPERQKLFDEVEADWAKREAKARRNADKGVGSEIRNSGDSDEDEDEDDEDEEDDEEDFSMECIVKGRNMPLNQFFRIARNTMSLWFKNSEPTVAEIEAEYWRHVAVRDSHVCVHSGSIDSSAFGFGFPSPKVKGSSCAKHPWNLKVLTNNSGSILRSLGPVMGITIPTLHVGMLFSACCWYRDPHGLPWIEYLHTGANKIWYGVPDDQNANFRAALTVLVPTHCQNKTIWLPCDTAMVPPHMLTDRNVSLCRTEQQPGQFVVVFPRAYTSSLCTGYAVSESVYFATNSWLDTAKDDFRDIQESCEPTMFSVEQLLFAIANDQRSNHDTLVQAYPMIVGIYEKEKQHRQTLKEQGVMKSEKIETKKKTVSLEEFECERCRANLYLSLVKVKATKPANNGGGGAGGGTGGAGGQDNDDDNDGSSTVDEEEEDRIYCLKHAVKHLADGGLQTKHCRLAYTYSLDDIEELLRKLQDRIANKKTSKSSVAGSSAGGGGGGGCSGNGGGGGGGGCAASGKGKSSLHLASTSSQSSSSYQAPSHSKFAGMATLLK